MSGGQRSLPFLENVWVLYYRWILLHPGWRTFSLEELKSSEIYTRKSHRESVWLDDLCLPIYVELERVEKTRDLNNVARAVKRSIVNPRVIRTRIKAVSSCKSSSGSGFGGRRQ